MEREAERARYRGKGSYKNRLCFPGGGGAGAGAGAAAAAAKSLQSCLTLCDPIDCSLPGSPIHGILQARTLEWVAISSPMQESEK